MKKGKTDNKSNKPNFKKIEKQKKMYLVYSVRNSRRVHIHKTKLGFSELKNSCFSFPSVLASLDLTFSVPIKVPGSAHAKFLCPSVLSDCKVVKRIRKYHTNFFN